MIERLVPPVGDSDLEALARLLVDAVESGATVSFVSPLTPERAEDWWRRTTSSSDARAVFLVARDAEGIVGTVQLHPAWAPISHIEPRLPSCWSTAAAGRRVLAPS